MKITYKDSVGNDRDLDDLINDFNRRISQNLCSINLLSKINEDQNDRADNQKEKLDNAILAIAKLIKEVADIQIQLKEQSDKQVTLWECVKNTFKSKNPSNIKTSEINLK